MLGNKEDPGYSVIDSALGDFFYMHRPEPKQKPLHRFPPQFSINHLTARALGGHRPLATPTQDFLSRLRMPPGAMVM